MDDSQPESSSEQPSAPEGWERPPSLHSHAPEARPEAQLAGANPTASPPQPGGSPQHPASREGWAPPPPQPWGSTGATWHGGIAGANAANQQPTGGWNPPPDPYRPDLQAPHGQMTPDRAPQDPGANPYGGAIAPGSAREASGAPAGGVWSGPGDPWSRAGGAPGSAGWGGGGAWGPGGGEPGWNYPWQSPRPYPPGHRGVPGAVIALLLVVAVLVGLGIGHGVWSTVGTSSNSGSSGNGGLFSPFVGNGDGLGGNGSGGSGTSGSGIASSTIQSASKGLVDIVTSLTYEEGEAAGTGIVLTPNGIVLTNNHVITGATSIEATDVGNGQAYPAKVLGYDRNHDVAVLQLEGASGLHTDPIGDSSKVSVGDAIVGIGNAGGIGGAPTSAAGQVIALNQSITATDESNATSEQLTGLIATNADIQPGDSGGALVDTAGAVIGMDTAASDQFSFAGGGAQGFAIPINEAESISSQVRSGVASSTVHIGATAFLGVLISSNGSQTASGAAVSKVVDGSPAAQAGLADNDTITGLDGRTVDSPAALTRLITALSPGDRVQITWVDHDGTPHSATVRLGSGPPQ